MAERVRMRLHSCPGTLNKTGKENSAHYRPGA